MQTRAVPGIALRASNTSGGHYFMSLYSGKRIHGYKWDELPVDEYVIERVESLAEQEKQPLMHKGMPTFEWSSGVEVTDELEEEEDQVLQIQDEAEGNIIEPILEIEPGINQDALLEIDNQEIDQVIDAQDDELRPDNEKI